ncbi:MAG: nucleotidyltransferase domain-containing protein [Thermoplasmata archaeon]
MNDRVAKVLDELKTKLSHVYGDRLRKVILHGSWARGDATEDSDIDLVVVLEGDVSPGSEIERMIDAVTDVLLEYSEFVSVYPVSEDDYERVNSPLLMNARREGIPA